MISRSLTHGLLIAMTTLVLGTLALRVPSWMAPRQEAATPDAAPVSAPRVTLEMLPTDSSPRVSAPAAARPDAAAAEGARELSHRLRLLGTVLEDRPFAFIEDTLARTSRRYWINDAVASATVEAIHRGSVRLKTARGEQLILLLEPTLTSKAPSVSPEASEARHTSGALSIQFHPQLNAADGAFEGLVVEALEPPVLAQRLKLEPGDLIQTVNGQPLLSPAQSLQVFKKAWRQPELALELQRDGQLLERTVNLRAFQR